MSVSIYNVQNYNASLTYSSWDIVATTSDWNNLGLTGTSYLYNILAGIGSSSTPSSTQWDGYSTINGEVKPKFLWTPSYQSQSQQNPKILSVKFGDSYESRSPDGIENNLLTLDLQFENRSIDETCAIVHFLTQRNGTESFILTPQPPFSTPKRFVARQWRQVQNFFNNYSVTFSAEEVVN